MSAPAPALVVDALTARGRDGLALGPLTFTLDAGDALAVVGPSGAGKSLLLACLASLWPSQRAQPPQQPQPAPPAPPARVSMIFQRDALDDSVSALENVLHAAPSPSAALAALSRVGLADCAQRRPRQLSGGQRKRVGIARALAWQAPLLLADDPTAGLDPRTSREILDELFGAVAAACSALVIATADVDVLLPRCRRVLVLDAGRCAFLGDVAALGTSPFAPRALAEEAWL